MRLTEIVLKRRAVKQPMPKLFNGGDCGACCIAGVFNIAVQEAYELQDKDERPKDAKEKPYPFSWWGMRFALHAWEKGYSDGVLDDVPIWPWCETQMSLGHGIKSWYQNIPWFHYVRMGLLGGFYGVAQVDYNSRGPLFSHDHWVLICGARERESPHETVKGAHKLNQEILISCSSKNPQGYWKDTRDFLRDDGGYNVIMVRPRTSKK